MSINGKREILLLSSSMVIGTWDAILLGEFFNRLSVVSIVLSVNNDVLSVIFGFLKITYLQILPLVKAVIGVTFKVNGDKLSSDKVVSFEVDGLELLPTEVLLIVGFVTSDLTFCVVVFRFFFPLFGVEFVFTSKPSII